tara:strand:- start:1733 stop:2356 length:624 start_codon:yes stop_codon:yes gene_type:complete
MNLSGRQKSQLLISLLEDQSSNVLKHLSDESATILTSILDEAPTIEEDDKNEFLETVLQLINDKEFDLSTTEKDVDDSFLDFEDNEETNALEETGETTKDTEQNPYPENYRSLETIAKKLNVQENQMVAFFFKYADEAFSEAIQNYLSAEKLEAIKSYRVDANPMSQQIFKRLFDMIVLKTPEEIAEEQANQENNQTEEPEIDGFNL